MKVDRHRYCQPPSLPRIEGKSAPGGLAGAQA
jgi:hypothetical protein